jgi:hypothetical protein
MTMNFRLIKAALVELLGEQANDRYRVAGYQKRGQSALAIKGKNRVAQVYYSQGNFPKSGGSPSGFVKHDMSINVDLFVSMPTKANLRILQNEASSDEQIQTVLGDLRIAENLVDDAFDEFADDIFQVIMDARNRDLGLGDKVASRWVPTITKDNPTRFGQLVTLTGTMGLTCSKEEQVQGDIGIPFNVIDVTVDANEDPVGKAGAIVGLGDYLIQRGTLDNYIFRSTDDLVVTRPEA